VKRIKPKASANQTQPFSTEPIYESARFAVYYEWSHDWYVRRGVSSEDVEEKRYASGSYEDHAIMCDTSPRIDWVNLAQELAARVKKLETDGLTPW